MRVHADLAIELRVRHPQPAVSVRNEHVQPLHQLGDLLAVQVAAELVELRLVGLGLVLPLVVAAFQSPHIGPVRRRRVVRAEQIERGGDPLVEEALDHLGRHLARFHDAQEPIVAGAEVERLLLQHGVHGARQRIERRDREHGELELTVAIDELRVGEEIEPVVHQLVERPEQPLPLVGPALEQLRRLALSLVAEMAAEEIRHLPAMAHFLCHHAHQGQQIVVGGGVREQVALLLHRREFRVALVYDQVQERVPDPLVGDMHHRRPFALTFVMAELDVRYFLLPELRLELELSDLALGQADGILPVAEVVDPFIEVAELPDHQRLLLAGDAPAMRWRASGVANRSLCCAISRSSMPARDPASLLYNASLARRTAPAGSAAHCSAREPGAAPRPPCGTTRSTRPSASASAAGTMRALQTSSSALDGPTRRGRKKLPPQSWTRANLMKTLSIVALSDAMR